MDYRNLTDEQLKALASYDKEIKFPEHLETKFLNKIKKEFKPYSGNIVEFKRNRIFRRAAILAAAVIIFVLSPIFIINYISSTDSAAYTAIIFNGTVEVERDSEKFRLIGGDRLYQDDIVSTNEGAYLSISFNDDSIIWLNENSILVFETSNDNETVLTLLKGQVISSVASLEEYEVYRIITEELTVSVIGTIFLVEAGDGTTRVAVNKGVVNIDYFDENSEEQNIELKKSESFVISENKPEKTNGLTEDIINSFNQFEIINAEILKEELEENLSVQVNLTDVEEEIEEGELEWQIRNIYDFNNTRYENIINISTSKYYAVAQTLNSFICFNMSGNLMWEKTYDENESGLFDTPAVIHGNKLYASSNNKLIYIINLDNGRENAISMPGILSKYSNMTVYNNIIYLPFADGIYTLDANGLNISDGPVITFSSPIAIVKSINDYYVSSFVSKEISKYDSNYNEVWSTRFGDRLFSSPVLDDNIIVTSWSGNLFKLDYNGNILNEVNISNGFISAPCIYRNNLYILSNDGNLIVVNLNNFEILKTFQIDDYPNPETYVYKSAVINNNNLIIGSDSGKIIIYNLDTEVIEKSFETDNVSINTSAGFYNDTSFIGNNSGMIYLFKLAEVK